MGWMETRAVDERMRFVMAVVEREDSFAAVCRRFGVSRKTGYKWLKRYDEAEVEGLDKVFLDAGAEWRSAGCSMCLGMNPDQLAPGERSASTSNRNFEGRQGKGGRTHLVSPLVAAATAVTGHLSSPAELGS